VTAMEKKIYGLLGRKLGHSFSPQIHAALGNADYQLYPMEPEALGEFLRREDIGGVNVTIPYKRDVMDLCDELSVEARSIGSVNTIVKRPDGTLWGGNTDLYGLQYMARYCGVFFNGAKVLVFGSGGASLTAQAAARYAGAAEVVVISRGGENNYENLNRHFDAQILINATPVGMFPEAEGMPADPACFPQCRGVLDMVYNPRRTNFVEAARRLNIPCSDGLPMLVAQAKAAHELFFGVKVPDLRIYEILTELRLQQENAVIIGMPGSGKSAVGEALSRLSGREILDMDAEIARRASMPIPEIFAKYGEAHFRALEREVAADFGLQHGKIIITGGGVVKDPRNDIALKRNGRVYCLQRDISLLAREGRPLSENADLEAMARERGPMYERCMDVSVCNDGTVEQAAQRIWEDFLRNAAK